MHGINIFRGCIFSNYFKGLILNNYFWFITYNGLVFPFIFLLALFASIFSSKVREGLKGRLSTKKKLEIFSNKIKANEDIYWFHAASLGEFHEIKPIIKGIKKIGVEKRIIVSFFSPSGFNNAFSSAIDLKIYLPFDFLWSIQKTLTVIRPKKIIFSSYDIWPNLLWACKIKNIHLSLVSAKIQRTSIKFSPIVRNFYKTIYSLFNTIYTITEEDKKIFKELIGFNNKSIISSKGNPRFDKIYNDFEHKRITKNPVSKRNLIILIGSSHPEDDLILFPALKNLFNTFYDLRVIHAPHEPRKKQIKSIKKNYSKLGYESMILNDFKSIKTSSKKIIIVGEVGFLADLYWLSTISYIGGGFSSGIHNIMEPAIASNPIIFGPKHLKFIEAEQLIALGGGYYVNDTISLENTMKTLLTDENLLIESGKASFELIKKNIGASKGIINGILND